jgi:hypothetical protein
MSDWKVIAMEKQTVRRQLIKGSLAAPVVLTLSSASATSLSSFGRCLRNTGGTTSPEFFIDSTKPDGWFRKAVRVEQLSYQGQARGMFYRDPVLGRFVDTKSPYSMLSFGPSNMPAGWRVTGEGRRWALVYFDRASTSEYRYVTLQRPSGFSATTVSCYGSFRA